MSTLYPGSYQIPLMKYNGSPTRALVDKVFNTTGQWVAQEKKDGALYMLEKIDNEHIYLFARTISKKTGELVEKSANVPHIVEWAKSLPDDTILLGEIYVPGGKSNDVTKIMGCTPSNAIARQKGDGYGGFIHYYIFDCIRYDGEDFINEGFLYRFKRFQNWFFKQDVNVYIQLANVYEGKFEQVLHDIFSNGGEGMVFKRIDAVYEPGKRPTQTYFKVKEHIDSLDLICIGLEEPTRIYSGKEIEVWPYWIEKKYIDDNGTWHWEDAQRNCYEDWLQDNTSFEPVTKPWLKGWKNSIKLGLLDDNGSYVEVGHVASGITDEMRADMAENPDRYLNHVVQVSCMSINKKDFTIRHCVFERMREDKNVDECNIQTVFG